MRKASGVLHVLAVIGFAAQSATVAYAGGGLGGGSNELPAYQCYFINGDKPPHNVLNLVDQFGERTNVQVGHGRLLCAPVIGTKPDGGTFEPFQSGDHIKCYTISPFERGPRGHNRLFNPDAVVDLTDELDAPDPGVKVGVPAFLCTTGVLKVLLLP